MERLLILPFLLFASSGVPAVAQGPCHAQGHVATCTSDPSPSGRHLGVRKVAMLQRERSDVGKMRLHSARPSRSFDAFVDARGELGWLSLAVHSAQKNQAEVHALPTNLGIETTGHICRVICPSGAQFPSNFTAVFTSSVAEQTAMTISVCAGEDGSTEFERLGTVRVEGVPALPLHGASVDVTFNLESAVQIMVEARARPAQDGDPVPPKAVTTIESSASTGPASSATQGVEEQLEETQQIQVNMTVQNLDFSALQANDTLWNGVVTSVQETVAAKAGVVPDDVGVELFEGSVQVVATIPDDDDALASLSDATREEGVPSPLGEQLAAVLSAVSGIESATVGGAITASAKRPTKICTKKERTCDDGSVMPRDELTCQWLSCEGEGRMAGQKCDNVACNVPPCREPQILQQLHGDCCPSCVDPEAAGCTKEMRFCPDGTEMPLAENCEWLPCPKKPKPDPEPEPVACTKEMRFCPDGTEMPLAENCEWLPCPKKPKPDPEPEPVACTEEMRFCLDGTEMPRAENCEWVPCTTKPKPEPKPDELESDPNSEEDENCLTRETWSDEKRSWCCENKGVGCLQWAAQDAIPCGAIPSPKLALYDRCIIDNQCESNFCCPFMKSCLKSSSDPLPCTGSRAKELPCSRVNDVQQCPDALQGAKGGHQWCDVCDRNLVQKSPFTCKTVEMGAGVQPLLQDLGFGGPWDTSDVKCGCSEEFLTAYVARSWVARWKNDAWTPVCSK